ncbi:hypothetical protein KDK95_25220 [Actinospica sp. MGRD01-02]|uniref:HEAT repeat domain-containing protein n=1 Tax=Actinospica acidithermotolerans TaxID=2828514 RepID=A0A941IL48_9ACTN|nr:hypothetical protein [Actinospica acidithermotolerans]MBR7829632.1 hypothetical protein [Actinospica acidithermotolerans]
MRMGLGWRRVAKMEEITRIIRRALGYPMEDYRRWVVLAELRGLDTALVYEAGETLMRSGDPSSMALAGQILDGVFILGSPGPGIREAGRVLLDEICEWDQDPAVLSAALHPYAQLGGTNAAMLLALLQHTDARVRASAAQLIATVENAVGDAGIEQALVQALEEDEDSDVRIRAAAGLYLLAQDDPECLERAAELFADYLADPEPEIRCAALVITTIDDLPRRLDLVAQELDAAEPAWPFVDLCSGVEVEAATPAARERIRLRLRELWEVRWAERVRPDLYPDPAERAEMLDAAIAACGSA